MAFLALIKGFGATIPASPRASVVRRVSRATAILSSLPALFVVQVRRKMTTAQRWRYPRVARERVSGKRVSRSIEEARGPEIGKLGPLPSAYDLVGHRDAEERRHRHAAMGDGEVVAGD